MAGITDKEVRALIAKAQREAKAQYQVDGTVPGLTISASKTGIASWYIRYRLAGKQKERTIGQYPAWGAGDARERAKELRREIDGGVDIAVEKQRQKQEALLAITVDILAAEYFAKAEKGMTLKTGMRPHTYKQRKSLHERYVSPLIGRFEASTITPAQVVNVVKKAEAGGKTLPDITLTHCNLIFAHGIGNGACTANPCRDLKLTAIVGPQEPPKQRVALGLEELGDFLRELYRMPRPYELAVRLMLLTGVRINTIAEATISEFKPDFAVWEVPHERRKNRRQVHHSAARPGGRVGARIDQVGRRERISVAGESDTWGRATQSSFETNNGRRLGRPCTRRVRRKVAAHHASRFAVDLQVLVVGAAGGL